MNKIKQQNLMKMKRSALFQICRGKFFKKTEDIFPTLDLLEQYGYLRQESQMYKGKGRPSDVIIVINAEALKNI